MECYHLPRPIKPWNLGPSDKRKTSLVKPMVSKKTRILLETLNHFLGKSYQIFSRENGFLWPKHHTLITMNSQKDQNDSRTSLRFRKLFQDSFKNLENSERLPESDMQRLQLIKLTSNNFCYEKTRTNVKKMERNAWMMVMIFWEQKFFLPECLNESGFEEGTRRDLKVEKVWRLGEFWKFESSERFRKIWKRKGFNGEEGFLFIVISQSRFQRPRLNKKVWSCG